MTLCLRCQILKGLSSDFIFIPRPECVRLYKCDVVSQNQSDFRHITFFICCIMLTKGEPYNRQMVTTQSLQHEQFAIKHSLSSVLVWS